MKKEKRNEGGAVDGPKIYATISTKQYKIMTEIKNRTGLSIAAQLRSKIRDIEANFVNENPDFKIA